jgi:hypothetical protein
VAPSLEAFARGVVGYSSGQVFAAVGGRGGP